MDKLIEKLSSYNIFNYLLPGVLFSALGNRFTSYPLLFDNLVIGIFVYYFYGLIISRIGSLFLEPLLKWIRCVKFSPYSNFLEASKTDPQIELLSEINNMYRTMSSLFFCLLLLRGYESLERSYPSMSSVSFLIAIFLLMLLFILSYRKQSSYIRARIKQVSMKNQNRE